MSKKVIHSQAREIIYKVYQFMRKEKEAKQFIVDPNKLIERLAQATCISIRSLRRIAKEGNDHPRKTIAKPAPKSSVDQFDE